MSIRNLIAAAAVAAVVPMAFAQPDPSELRGEAWYPAAVPAQSLQARVPASSMPDMDFVAGEAGFIPHQHQLMRLNEMRTRAMGNRGEATPAAEIGVQRAREVEQYSRAGG